MRFYPVIMALSVVIILNSCGGGEENNSGANEQSELDSLRNELRAAHESARTLDEVGALMDSIDANRQSLRINMVEGSTYEQYVNRMQGLNNYVRETQKKISQLEKSLKKAKGTASVYEKTLRNLKREIESKNQEITELKAAVERYKTENENLLKVTELQEGELIEKEAQIDEKRNELAVIQQRIEEVLANSQVSEAESYFAQALAKEETARRTRLAPNKRNATLKEALELYKKANSLGHPKAKAEADRLETQLN